MTDRSANVRVNVTGNAGAELAKIDNAVKRVGAGAAQTAPKVALASKALDSAGKSASSAASKVTQLSGANARTTTSLSKVTKAADTAATGWKKAGDGAFGAAVKMRASANAIDQATRAIEGANRRSTNTAQYQRVLSVWQRIATAIRSAATSAGQFARTQGGRDIGGFLSRAGRFAGAVGSVAGLGLDTARSAGGTLGIASRDQLASQFVEMQLGRIRLANQAHLDEAGRRTLDEQISGAARGSLQSPEAIQSGLETAQNRFSNLDFFARNAEVLGRASTALGASFDDIVGAAGEFNRSMGVRADEVNELIGVMEQQAEKGSIEARDIATSFAGSIGMYQRVTGDTGMRGMRSFGAVAQTLGTGTASPAEAATLMENLLGKLANPDVMRGLQRAGIQTQEQSRDAAGNLRTDARGRPVMEMRDLGAIFGDMAAHQTLGTSEGARRRIFGNDLQANQAVGIILSRLQEASARGEANPLTALAGVDAGAGNATITRTMDQIGGSAAGGVLKARVNAEANFTENGEALVRQMTSMATAASELDTRFPRLSADIDIARGAFSTLTGTIGAMNLAAGANVAGSVAGGTGALGAAGGAGGVGAAVAAGMAAFAGTVALQDAVIGNRNGGGTASENVAQFFRNFGNWGATDDRATNRSGAAERVMAERQREAAARAAAPATDDRALAAQQETNRHLRAIAGNTAGRGGEPSTVPP